MAGIAGVVSGKAESECRRLVRTMLSSMRHDLSSEWGECGSPQAGVYAGWIAHRDSYAAREGRRQDEEVAIAAAGEFVSDGAPPDLRAVYRNEGRAFPAGLNGVCSGLILDRGRQGAILFTDRYGLERLYAHQDGDTFFFASEAKALLRVLPHLRSLHEEGVTEWLAYGFVRPPLTLFRGVEVLPAGHTWTIEKTGRRQHRYFAPGEWEAGPELGSAEFESALPRVIGQASARCMEGDGTLGVSLTGGLDTRMIMALAPRARPVVCYTFGGEHQTMDERLAARVALAAGFEHQVLRVGSDFLRDYASHVDRTIHLTDGCASALGAHEPYLNAKARALSTVRVTGNFGSEVLRGTSTMKPLALRPGLLRSDLAHADGEVAANARFAQHPVTRAAFQEIPWSLYGTWAAGRSQLTIRTPYLDTEVVDLAFRAAPAVRSSQELWLRAVGRADPLMARIPTDRGVLLSDGRTRGLVRRLGSEVTFKLDYWRTSGLPRWARPLEAIVEAGFESGRVPVHRYLEYHRWFRRELAPCVREVLTDRRTIELPYWRGRDALESMAVNHAAGHGTYVKEIGAVLTLEAIDRLLCTKPAPVPELAGARD